MSCLIEEVRARHPQLGHQGLSGRTRFAARIGASGLTIILATANKLVRARHSLSGLRCRLGRARCGRTSVLGFRESLATANKNYN